ncbi:MAG TPA: hypothetical protein VHI78_05830, partial [Bacteroidales bacterium]|nr:hypothetical protein [Bacteroidales bacterium]
MEENSINPESASQNLNLDPNGISHLMETRAWTNFISIIGFVFLGFLLLAGIAGGSAMTRMSPMAAELSSGVFI